MRNFELTNLEIRMIVWSLDNKIEDLNKDIIALSKSSARAQNYIPFNKKLIEETQNLINKFTM